MTIKNAFLAVLFLTAMNLAAQGLPPNGEGAPSFLANSPRHGEWVTVDAGRGDKVDLWIVYPERMDKAPVVFVIHENMGLNDWARAVADSLAAEGFIAVAPDFLTGKGPDGGGSMTMTPDQCRTINTGLKQDEVFRRLDAAVKYALMLPAASKKFGVVGFCWGGAMSFAWATHKKDLSAAVVYYGTSPESGMLKRIKAPVLGLYGGNDARVNTTVTPAADEMKRLKKRYETETYEGAGHAFLRLQDGANLMATQAAWPRTLMFLRENLENR